MITAILTDELSNAAVDFIDRQKDNPFFLYLAYNAPHAPLQATQKYLDRFQHIANKKRRTYAAMVSAVDDGVGKVLAKLDEHSLNNDTLIVFLSDNGGPLGTNGSSNDPLRGGKGSPFEGGIRIPFAVRWTGTLPAGVDYQPEERPLLDGVDLSPVLFEDGSLAERDLYWIWNPTINRWALRSGDWKIVKYGQGEPKGPNDWKLFNLRSDPREQTDVAANNAKVVDKLHRLFVEQRSKDAS